MTVANMSESKKKEEATKVLIFKKVESINL
jgi:hypothetical protein